MIEDESGDRSSYLGHVPGGAIWTALIEHRFAYLALWDALSWTVAIAFAVWIRYDFQAGSVDWAGVVTTLPLVIGVQVAVGIWQGLYVGRWTSAPSRRSPPSFAR